MKKLINGKEIKLDVEFFSDCLKGKIINPTLPNNINNLSDNIPKQVSNIIEKYKKIYKNLNFLIRFNQCDLKYCLLGELLNLDYYIENNILKVKIDSKQVLALKEEYWGIDKLSKKGKTWKDYDSSPNYRYFNSYLSDPKNFIENNFTELYNAYNKNEDLIERDLDTLLHFIDVKDFNLKENEFIDVDTFVKYKLVPYYMGDSKIDSKESMFIDLDNKQTHKASAVKDVYNFTLYKQNLIEGQTGTRDFTELKEVKDDRFNEIKKELLKANIRNTKGFIIKYDIFYQVGKDIYRSNSKSNEKIIQNGEIYGIYNNKLLIKNSKKDNNSINHNQIYLLDDNYLDLVSVNFTKE